MAAITDRVTFPTASERNPTLLSDHVYFGLLRLWSAKAAAELIQTQGIGYSIPHVPKEPS